MAGAEVHQDGVAIRVLSLSGTRKSREPHSDLDHRSQTMHIAWFGQRRGVGFGIPCAHPSGRLDWGRAKMCAEWADQTRCCDHICGADRKEAREIQDSLVPGSGLKTGEFELAFRYSPLKEVGGDFADFFTLPDGKIGLYVGDVVGKGLAAAMYAALVMGLLRAVNKSGTTPAAVLEMLNKRMLVRPVAGRYSATLYALFDPATNELTFANAGLPYPLLVSANGTTELKLGGLPSGLFPGATYDQYTIRLHPGDMVLFATDGVHESRNHWDEDYGWEQLSETWLHCAKQSASDSLDTLFDSVKLFSRYVEQRDDITAVALKFPVHAAKEVTAVAPALSEATTAAP
jgi:phosphoserine phosphatase RsbU/P